LFNKRIHAGRAAAALRHVTVKTLDRSAAPSGGLRLVSFGLVLLVEIERVEPRQRSVRHAVFEPSNTTMADNLDGGDVGFSGRFRSPRTRKDVQEFA